jgi:hypothetical protein
MLVTCLSHHPRDVSLHAHLGRLLLERAQLEASLSSSSVSPGFSPLPPALPFSPLPLLLSLSTPALLSPSSRSLLHARSLWVFFRSSFSQCLTCWVFQTSHISRIIIPSSISPPSLTLCISAGTHT